MRIIERASKDLIDRKVFYASQAANQILGKALISRRAIKYKQLAFLFAYSINALIQKYKGKIKNVGIQSDDIKQIKLIIDYQES